MPRTSFQSVSAERRYYKNAEDAPNEQWRITCKDPAASKNSRTKNEIGNQMLSDTRLANAGYAFKSPYETPISAENQNAISVTTQYWDMKTRNRDHAEIFARESRNSMQGLVA